MLFFFFFQAEDGIRDLTVTGVQTCALPICQRSLSSARGSPLQFHACSCTAAAPRSSLPASLPACRRTGLVPSSFSPRFQGRGCCCCRDESFRASAPRSPCWMCTGG